MDLHCWSNCTDDVLLIANQPVIAGIVSGAIPTFELAAGGVIAFLAIRWLLSCPPARRRAVAVIAVPAVLVGVGGVSHGLALLADPHEGPRFVLHLALSRPSLGRRAPGAGPRLDGHPYLRRRSAVLRLAAEFADAPAPEAWRRHSRRPPAIPAWRSCTGCRNGTGTSMGRADPASSPCRVLTER